MCAEEESGKKGEGRWTRGTKVRNRRVLARRDFHGFRWLARRRPSRCWSSVDTLGGYRLTAIRLNLFHHKRLNKEVHSSGAENPLRSHRRPVPNPSGPAHYPYRTLSTTYDHPSGSLPLSELKAPTNVIVRPVSLFRWIFSRYRQSVSLQREIESSALRFYGGGDG